MNHPTSSPRLFAAAVSEWLLVLPAAVFLAAAALRQLQPRQFEPARTSWMLFEWATTHVTRAGAGVLFLVLPAIAVAGGCATLFMFWRKSETLRQDFAACLASLRRHFAIAALGTGTLLAGAILAAVLLHIITD
ncbi:MAG TPA: hypothetical protein VFI60_01665 [Candidatus Acidoferrum sp.]|nr:hypothetical protein [Candidatus Acidoferrum sp.]